MHSRLSSRRRLLACCAVLSLAALTLLDVGGTPSANAAFDGTYGAQAVITFGSPVHTQMSVTADLPVPAAGGAITSVTASWQEPVPQSDDGLTTTHRLSFDTSACTADAPCRVETVLPTARMANGTPPVTFTVSNADGLVSFFTRNPVVANAKPTVALTMPLQNSALWGQVTIAADAAASREAGAAPLAGVRFYLDGSLNDDSPYLFDTVAPYWVTVPATDIAPVLSSRDIVAVAEDTDGNLSVMATGDGKAARRHVTIGPDPEVRVAPVWPGDAVGSVETGVGSTSPQRSPIPRPRARPAPPTRTSPA